MRFPPPPKPADPTAPSDPMVEDRAAYERTAEARAALRAVGLPPFTLDATFAVSRALQAARAVQPLRERMLGLAPEFDVAHLDGLETLARALAHAHTEVERHVVRDDLPDQRREARALRRLLLGYADLLSRKQALSPRLIGQLRRGAGDGDLAEDLFVLVAALSELPAPVIGPEALVTPADLAQASGLAHAIQLRWVDRRPRRGPADLLAERRKLGALLLRSHRQVWRAVSFLRFDQGDVDRLVPSLYVARKGRR